MFADRERIAADMGHLGAVLAMFDSDVDLTAIPAIRPYKPHRGRWMAEHGIDPADFRTMTTIECSLQAVLLRLVRMGLITAAGKPRRWVIAPEGVFDGLKGWRVA